MLTELRIAGLGVIGDAALELGAGFTAVTGETGAGKTMIVTGLGLLTGEKAEQADPAWGRACARGGASERGPGTGGPHRRERRGDRRR